VKRKSRELFAATTPGPWLRKDKQDYAEIHNSDTWGKAMPAIALVADSDNADAIVMAYNNLPFALDLLDRKDNILAERDAEIERLNIDLNRACDAAMKVAGECDELAKRCAALKGLIKPHHTLCLHGKGCDYISAVTHRPDCMACDDFELDEVYISLAEENEKGASPVIPGFEDTQQNLNQIIITGGQKMDYAKLREEFEALSKPLIKFLNDNFNPHSKIIIEPDGAEVVSGEMSVRTQEFILD
jgi:hypothetical protein